MYVCIHVRVYMLYTNDAGGAAPAGVLLAAAPGQRGATGLDYIHV